MSTTENDGTKADLENALPHTRLPWQRSGVREKAAFGNVGTDGHNVGPDSDPVAFVFYSDRTPDLHAETLGNANFIVRACNNHEALIRALEHCQQVLAMMVQPDRIIRTSSMQAWTEAMSAEAGARIALKLAKDTP